MPDLRVRRTLVKSPPELWAELSEVDGLARHLGEFGEIKITRAEAESTVAWEGESASGVVELEPTGWGTKVTITAEVPEPSPPPPVPDPQAPAAVPVAAEPEPGPDPLDPEPDPFDPEPVAEAEPPPQPRKRGFFARWLFRERRDDAPVAPPTALADFPEPPEPQLPAWEAEAREPEAEHDEPEVEEHEAPRVELEDDFEFDFEIRRGHVDATANEDVEGPEPIGPERAREVLEEALESLGQAHHRPFSRG